MKRHQLYFDAEEQAIKAGDLDAATQVKLNFWVAPDTTTRCARSSAARSSCRRRTPSRS
jgi:hypothetical protein